MAGIVEFTGNSGIVIYDYLKIAFPENVQEARPAKLRCTSLSYKPEYVSAIAFG